MSPACKRIDGKEFDCAKIGEEFPFGNGGFAFLWSDAHTVWLFGVGHQRQVDGPFCLSNRAADEGKISFAY